MPYQNTENPTIETGNGSGTGHICLSEHSQALKRQRRLRTPRETIGNGGFADDPSNVHVNVNINESPEAREKRRRANDACAKWRQKHREYVDELKKKLNRKKKKNVQLKAINQDLKKRNIYLTNLLERYQFQPHQVELIEMS